MFIVVRVLEIIKINLQPKSLDDHRSKQDEQGGEDERQQGHHFTPAEQRRHYSRTTSYIFVCLTRSCLPVVVQDVVNDLKQVVVTCRDPSDEEHL